jgi:hypothetical protein
MFAALAALALNVLGSLTRRWSRERLQRLAPQRVDVVIGVPLPARHEGTAYRPIPRWRRSARHRRFTCYFSALQHRRREPGRDFAVNLRNAYRHGNHTGPHHTDAYDDHRFTGTAELLRLRHHGAGAAALPGCSSRPAPRAVAGAGPGLASACFSYSRTATRCRWGYR